MTYHAIPPEQKELLQEQPVLREEPERDIIQYTYVVKKEDYDAGREKRTELSLDDFWACGYHISVDISVALRHGCWIMIYI